MKVPSQLCVIVKTPHLDINDRNELFGVEDDVIFINPNEEDMYDLIVQLGVFPSKGQARKNWKKTNQIIPNGWSEFVVAKHPPRFLYIWNPIHFVDKWAEPNEFSYICPCERKS